VRHLALPVLALLLVTGCPKTQDPPPKAPATAPTPAAEPPPPAEPTKVAEGGPCAATAACAEGLVCTTETGACDKPPGCGPEDICPQVCYGVCAAPKGGGDEPGCETDADCRTFSNYCGGCACDALLESEAEPKCASRPVNCIVDPCRGRVARCLEGACVLRDGSDEK